MAPKPKANIGHNPFPCKIATTVPCTTTKASSRKVHQRLRCARLKIKRALHEEHEHIQEAHQVAPGACGGVIPESIDGGPGKQIAVIFTDDFYKVLFEFELPAEDQATARRFEEDDEHEHQYHRALRGDFRHILSKPVIKELRLKDMQNDESEMGRDHGPVEPAQTVPEPGLFALSKIEDDPGDEVVQQIAAPGSEPRQRVGFLNCQG